MTQWGQVMVRFDNDNGTVGGEEVLYSIQNMENNYCRKNTVQWMSQKIYHEVEATTDRWDWTLTGLDSYHQKLIFGQHMLSNLGKITFTNYK